MKLSWSLVLVFLTNAALSAPIEGKMPTAKAVSQAAAKLASDADIVSDSLNKLPNLTSQEDIRSTSQLGVDAESDEGALLVVLATAAGEDGRASNEKLQTFGPTVLRELKAMNMAATPEAVKKSISEIEKVRNPNILPSITQLSNAALKKIGLPPNQKNFPPTGCGA